MNKVRAKFTVANITEEANATRIEMTPVSSGSKENDAFFAATPSGAITLMIKNENAKKQFTEGDSYYVDFTKA